MKDMDCGRVDPFMQTADSLRKWFVVPMDKKRPFIYKFQTEKAKYIYDVNTLQILSVDPIVWDIISDIGALRSDEIVSKYLKFYKADQIVTAIKEIEALRETGNTFLSRYPEISDAICCEDNLRDQLEHHRRILTLNVTEQCNFRCSYCVYGGDYIKRSHSGRSMNWETAKKAIDSFLERNGTKELSIGFYGGEPLLNLALIKRCVSYANNLAQGDLHYTVTTNGWLLDEIAAEFLVKENFSIVISLDGPQNIHDRNRKTMHGEPTWENVVSNIKNFREKYPIYSNSKLSITGVMTEPLNVIDLNSFFSDTPLLQDIGNIRASYVSQTKKNTVFTQKIDGMKELKATFIEALINGDINNNPVDHKFRFKRSLFESDFIRFHKRLDALHAFKKQHGLCNGSLIPEKYACGGMCIPGVRRTFVTVDGLYYPCERVSETESMRIGDVNHGFDISKIRQLLKDWLDANKDQCQTCWCLPICSPGCYSNVMFGERLLPKEKQVACANYRNRSHTMLLDYCQILENNPHAFDYIENIYVG